MILNRVIMIGAGTAITALAIAYLYKSYQLSELETQLAAEREKAMEQSLQLKDQIEDLRIKNEKENQQADATIANLRRRIANGVRLPAAQPMPQNTGAKDGKDGCRLDPELAERLISIAEKGDRAIRALNQCIDSYNAIYMQNLSQNNKNKD